MSDVGFINGLLQTQEADPATPWAEDAFGYLRPVTGNGDNGLKIGSEVQLATASGDDSTGDAENPGANIEYDTDHWQNKEVPESLPFNDPANGLGYNTDYSTPYAVSMSSDYTAAGYVVFSTSGSWSAGVNAVTNQWVKIESGNKRIIAYQLDGDVTGPRNPKDFDLEGWDGGQWVTLDSRVDQDFGAGESPVYSISNPGTYSRYRLYIYNNQGDANWLRLGELRLFESAGYASADNTVDFDMQFSGTVSFSPASLIVKNSSDAAITTGNLNIAYNHNGAGFTSPIDIDAFKALDKTLFNGTTSLKLQVQPVGATAVKSLSIQSQGTEMKVEAGTPDVVLSQDGVEVARLATKADVADMRTNAVATVTTTDATVTDLAVIEVAEGEVYSVEVDVIAEEAGTNRALYKMSGLFYRNASGDVTQQGSTAVLNEIESEPLWDCDFVADTANQTIDVRVTGEAATTIEWKVHVQYHKL